MTKATVALLFLAAAAAGVLEAGIDLVTLPARDSVQLTIYNSADLTLVRDRRTLTLQRGGNRLQFAWAGTLIDPTSLQLAFPGHRDRVSTAELSFPPRVSGLGAWRVNSDLAGRVPAQLTFFTAGVSWRARYHGILSADESVLELACCVRTDNNSGEDYGNARVRLVVGTIALLDEIAALARRWPPHGRPDGLIPISAIGGARFRGREEESVIQLGFADGRLMMDAIAPKEIIREGVSEYFLYTIPGEENIPHGWGRRLPAFAVAGVPVANLFRFEEERFGEAVVRFLVFKNDAGHRLGNEPLPDGLFQVFQVSGEDGALRYLGADQARYIPVGQEAELNLGAVRDLEVKAVLMKTAAENFRFDGNGDITGWDEVNDWRLKATNYRGVPARVEIRRNLPHAYWDISPDGPAGDFRRVDLDTVEFAFTLAAGESREIDYRVRLFEGTRRERR